MLQDVVELLIPLLIHAIDGYGSKSTNSDLAGFYLLFYIRQHAGLFRRRTNVNDVFDNKKIVSCQ
jgi:hypothetical protein